MRIVSSARKTVAPMDSQRWSLEPLVSFHLSHNTRGALAAPPPIHNPVARERCGDYDFFSLSLPATKNRACGIKSKGVRGLILLLYSSFFPYLSSGLMFTLGSDISRRMFEFGAQIKRILLWLALICSPVSCGHIFTIRPLGIHRHTQESIREK